MKKKASLVLRMLVAAPRCAGRLLTGLAALLASDAVAATIPVSTTDDTSAIACTLRDAITAANVDAASGACPAGAGDDVVDLTGLTGEISLATALPALATNMQIRGPGAALLTIDGAEERRVFDLTAGTIAISDLRIFRGFAPEMFGAGGGVRCVRATMTLARVVVTGSRAFFGGAIFVGSCAATIESSAIVLNSTSGAAGAGIANSSSTLALINTTVSGNVNTGTNSPGAGLNQVSGAVTITNCTFSGNTGTGLGGWAIANSVLDPPEEPDDPVTGTLHLANTLITNNNGPNCSGPIISDGHNLSEDATCGLTAPSDRPSTPANLVVLADNGGPTPTHALSPGSAALDLGAACPPTDQRGVERPVDGDADGVARCDVGAFERGCREGLPSGTACAPATNACVDDVCDALTLTCQHASNTGPCDDGDACTLGDSCNGGGVCAGTPAPCPVAGSLTFGACISAATQTGPTGTNACAQVAVATASGQESGFDNLRAAVESADGTSVYVIGGNDDAVAHFARDPSTGVLTYQGCITGEIESGPTGTNACAQIGSAASQGQNSGLDLPQSLALSPDGKSLYTASRLDDAVARFDRDPATGVLTYQGCLTGETESAAACTTISGATVGGIDSGLDDLRALAVSPDGTSVYAASSLDDAVARFDRDPATGALAYQGCLTGETESATACTPIGGATSLGASSGLDELNGLALSADGKSLYTVSLSDDAVARFDRDPATGALTYQGCITGEVESNGAACTKIPAASVLGLESGLDELFALALSPDGTSLYAVSQGDAAVAHFQRDPTTGALTYQGCLTGEIASGRALPIPGSGACTQVASATPRASESGFHKFRSLAVSADGESLYAASPADDAVAHFVRDLTTGALVYESCLSGEVATGPTGTNACAAIGSATPFGTASGVDNPQALVVSADGRTLYTASGNDAAVAGFALAPELATTTTSTTLPPQPISGTALLIVDPAASKRRIVFTARDARLDTSAGSGIDPVANGAVLQVFNDAGTGDSACLDLPAAGWTAKGKPAKRTFRYKDKRFARGPCRAVTVKDGKLLEVVCLAKAQPISYSLDEAAQQRVGVRFRSGATEYCAVFGGRVVKDVQNKKFAARKAPAPAACPVAPVACP